MSYINLIINGKNVVAGEFNRRLVDFLREDLGLTGVKEGCSGSGLCGTCSVIVNGELRKSCKLTVGQVEGKSVVTIEGLGTPENPHPIQIAFVLSGAMQCGFCTPGMIMATKVLLDRYPNPTPEQIVNGLHSQICRCTGYIKIIEAVQLAAKFILGEQKPILIGRTVRPDGLAKATGTAVYGADLKFPAMTHAVVVRSPHPHAQIVDIDISEALKQNGVLDVITARDIPGINRYLRLAEDQPVLAEQVVRFMGEPVVAVCATSLQLAVQAAACIKIKYNPLPAVFNPFESLESDAPQIHPQGNLLAAEQMSVGDVDKAFENATVIVEGEFRTPWQEHAYMGTEAGLAFWDEQTGRVVVIGDNQGPYETAGQIARVLGINGEMVEVQQATIGGAYGGKIDLSYHCFVALFAQRLRKPVKMVYSREESFSSSPKRHPFYMKCRIGADQRGKLQAIDMEIVSDNGAYASQGPGVAKRSTILAPGPYNIPNIKVDTKFVYTNNPIAGAFRGYGVIQTNFAVESLLDEVARKLNIDPIVLRLNNAYRPGDITGSGQALGDDVGFVEALNTLKKQVPDVCKTSQDSNGPIRIGRGVAAYWYGVGRTKASNAAKAEIELNKEGNFCLKSSAVELGQGATLTFMLLASQALGNQPLNRIRTTLGNSITTPDAGSTSASRQTFTSSKAIALAAADLKQKIFTRAGEILEEEEANLCLAPGVVKSLKTGAELELEQIVKDSSLVGFGNHVSSSKLADGITPAPYEIYAFGAQLAEVEVNVDTGHVSVKRMVGVFDSGNIVNYQGAEGQAQGGMVMGLGFTLKENFIPMTTKNFDTYRLPRIDDVPQIEAVFVQGPNPGEAFGAKGLGEFPLIPTPAAICNAIYDACGKRVHELPVKL